MLKVAIKLRQFSAVYWIASGAFLLRLVARLHSGIDLFWVNGYTFFFDLAQNIASGHGFSFPGGAPTAFRVPLYPIFLAGLTLGHRLFWPIAIAESAMGALTVVYAAKLAAILFPGRMSIGVANLAAAITAVYPYYVVHDTALEETSLFTLLTLVSVVALLRSRNSRRVSSGILAGLLLGLDVLTRATIAPFALLAPFWLAWRVRARVGFACALMSVAVVIPWLWRNELVVGAPTLSTESGVELWNGNNGFLFRYYPQQSSDLSKAEALDALTPQEKSEWTARSGSELLESQWFAQRARAYIEAHPRQTLVDGFRKIAAGFSVLPSPRRGTFADLVHAFTYGPVMILGLWGMWRRRAHWQDDLLIYLLFVTFMMVTAVFWAHTSHRAFLDVYWIVYAAGAIAAKARYFEVDVPSTHAAEPGTSV